MRSVTLPAAILVLMVLALPAQGTTWHVPGDAPTIYAGINLAGAGDTVLVACGTYHEYGITLKPGVCLRSETGLPECVTIDADDQSIIFTATSGDSTMRIEGFTLTDVYAPGVAVYLNGSSPRISRCSFVGNHGSTAGALLLTSASPSISYCSFVGNSAYNGAVYLNYSSPSISHCSFEGNSGSLDGGAMMIANSSARITDCTFSNNSAGSWGEPSSSRSVPTRS